MTSFDKQKHDAIFAAASIDNHAIEILSIGELFVGTGKLVACDPGSTRINEAVPFELTVPIGQHRVELAVVPYSGMKRVAGAKIVFSQDLPATFRLATIPGDDTSKLAHGEFFGFGVSTGQACFVDHSAVPEFLGPLYEAEQIYDQLQEQFESTGEIWGELKSSTDGEKNLLAFSSGWGDGRYASYFGFCNSNVPCCLFVDFQLTVDDD